MALIPRLALSMLFLEEPIGLDDMHQYDMLGRSLAAGDGFRWYQRADVERLKRYLERYYRLDILPIEQIPPEGLETTFRAPGYPLFLAGIYRLNGLETRLPAARLVQAVLSAAMAPLSALLALELGVRKKGPLLAGLMVAGYPTLWLYPLGLASENTFMPLLLLSVLVLLRAARSRRLREALLAGALLGAATLTRGALGLFLPLAALWLWRRAGWRMAALMILTVSALVIPWSFRNSRILGQPAFVETTLGYNLFIGYHPQGNGAFLTEIAVLPLEYIEDGLRDRWARQQALRFVEADPRRAVALSVRRLAFFWGLEGRELIYFYSNNFFGPLPTLGVVLAYVVIASPLAVIGVLAPFGAAAVEKPGRGLLLGLIGATMLAYIPILADSRFHVPLVPFLAVFAAGALSTCDLAGRARAGVLQGQTPWRLALLSALVLLSIWAWDLARLWPRLQVLFGPGGNVSFMNY